MPLPTIVTPSYELNLPSSGKKIKYRPFLVKEEKILILAIESGSIKDISRAIKDVLKNCILTKGVKIDELPTFDIEYLFLNIRSRSIGESIDLELLVLMIMKLKSINRFILMRLKSKLMKIIILTLNLTILIQ